VDGGILERVTHIPMVDWRLILVLLQQPGVTAGLKVGDTVLSRPIAWYGSQLGLYCAATTQANKNAFTLPGNTCSPQSTTAMMTQRGVDFAAAATKNNWFSGPASAVRKAHRHSRWRSWKSSPPCQQCWLNMDTVAATNSLY